MNTVIKLSSPATRQFWEIPVLYEDEHLLALDKPSDLLTSPDPASADRPSLMQLLHAGIARGEALGAGARPCLPGGRAPARCGGQRHPAAGQDQAGARRAVNLFGAEKPGRKFLALVQGAPAEDRFEVDAKLAPHPFRARLMHVDPRRGKRSRTVFAVQEKLAVSRSCNAKP